jgi:predicted DNA-binding protein
MDTTRWKSILVPREVYEEIKELSKNEGRTIGGQLRLVFDWYKEAQAAGANLDERLDERSR